MMKQRYILTVNSKLVGMRTRWIQKHFLWLSDNVTYFVEQLQPKETDVNHYKVIFNPSVIIPDIELR